MIIAVFIPTGHRNEVSASPTGKPAEIIMPETSTGNAGPDRDQRSDPDDRDSSLSQAASLTREHGELDPELSPGQAADERRSWTVCNHIYSQ